MEPGTGRGRSLRYDGSRSWTWLDAGLDGGAGEDAQVGLIGAFEAATPIENENDR